jgi:hypothetical protein
LQQQKVKEELYLYLQREDCHFIGGYGTNARVIDVATNKIQFLKEKHHLFMRFADGL